MIINWLIKGTLYHSIMIITLDNCDIDSKTGQVMNPNTLSNPISNEKTEALLFLEKEFSD